MRREGGSVRCQLVSGAFDQDLLKVRRVSPKSVDVSEIQREDNLMMIVFRSRQPSTSCLR